MDLKEFVAESLKEIINGVKEVQGHANTKGAEVCPILIIKNENNSKSAFYMAENSKRKVSFVKYDIAVSAEESKKKGGKGKLSIKVASLLNAEANGWRKKTKKESSLSRLQFELPVVWPVQDEHNE